jgi:drug/metabolite transporter (DMT)-like permease
MSRQDQTGLAIALIFVALVLFDFMGLIVKLLAPSYGAAELSAYRNLFGVIPSIIVLYSTPSWRKAGRPMRLRQWPLVTLRGLGITLAQFQFYLSLGLLDFATATTISYAMALFATAFAVPLLGEKVGVVRWLAVLVGFGGVVMVMGPGGDSFTWHALLPLGAAALYAFAGVTARLLDDDAPTPLVNFYSTLIAGVGSLVLTLSTGGFTGIASVEDLGWIAAMGCFGGAAALFLVYAYRMTEPSNLSPFNYFGIPIAFLFGWMFFDEAPFDDLFPGAILITGGGLMIIWRERRRRRSQSQ